MKIEIETKFDLGQKVYRKSDGLYVEILSMELRENDGRIKCLYCCHEINGNLTINCLEDVLTAERPKPKSIYDLKVGDEYFTLLTREEAEKEAKRLKIHQQLKKLACEYTFEFGENNYYIEYDFFPYSGKGYVDIRKDLFKYDPFKIYFKSELDALNAINEIGAETLMRDYFRIED